MKLNEIRDNPEPIVRINVQTQEAWLGVEGGDWKAAKKLNLDWQAADSK